MAELEKGSASVSLGRKIRLTADYRGETDAQLSALLGITPKLLARLKSVELCCVDAMAREERRR